MTDAAPAPGNIPDGYVGPASLPGGRLIYWTGRVAIGLRYQPPRVDLPAKDALFLQSALLDDRISH